MVFISLAAQQGHRPLMHDKQNDRTLIPCNGIGPANDTAEAGGPYPHAEMTLLLWGNSTTNANVFC
jgi:hypothetical protein